MVTRLPSPPPLLQFSFCKKYSRRTLRKRAGQGSWGWGALSLLCSRFLAGPSTSSTGRVPKVPRAAIPLRKHLVLREYVLPEKVDMTLVKGAVSLCLSRRLWVGQGKRQTSSLGQPETPTLWPPAGKLKSDREGPCPGQKPRAVCYLPPPCS